MGIPRLLPFLRSISRPRHLCEYKGSVAGIDGHVWLHRSIYTDAENFASGFDVNSHVRYFVRRIRKIVTSGIRPVVVFDGADLPAKRTTHRNRSSNRAVSMGRAVALRETGLCSESYNEFAKATDLRFGLVRDIMEALREEGIEAVVAPYEADAQLTLLSKLGAVDFVMTEDSDLLVYGCTRVLFKWDPDSMFGIEVSGSLVNAIPFSGMSHNDAVTACILAGSDYSPGIRGIGISKAIDLVKCCSQDTFGAAQLEEVTHKISQRAPFDIDSGTLIDSLRVAKWVFQHQTVFQPNDTSGLIPLNPYDGEEITRYAEYLGRIYDNTIAEGVYRGRVHPVTLSIYVEPDGSVKSKFSNIVFNS